MNNQILITKEEFDSLKKEKEVIEISLNGRYKEVNDWKNSYGNLERDYMFFNAYFNQTLNKFLLKRDYGIRCCFGMIDFWSKKKKYFERSEDQEILGDSRFPKIIPLKEKYQKEFYSSDDEKIYKFNLFYYFKID